MEAFADRISAPSEKQIIFQFAEQFPLLPVSQITQIVVSCGNDAQQAQKLLEEVEKDRKNPQKPGVLIPQKSTANTVSVFPNRDDQNGVEIVVLPNLKLSSFQQFVAKKCNIKGKVPI